MSPESVIVTTTEDKYYLDCVEQLCVDDSHKYLEWWDHENRQLVTKEIQGKILSVFVV